jgi:DNA-binding transcriptional ArsR family regulator
MAEAPASQAETVAALLERSGRDALPLRRSFVQIRQRGGGPGPLSAFVQGRRGLALDLYLLGRAVASQEPFDVAMPADVWIRALGLSSASGAGSTISKSWSWLEAQRLITSSRRGRLREVRFLREDGSGRPYRHPGRDEEARGDYFKLPYAYWEGNYPGRLGLPAKALLLIALSLGEDFWLPRERGASWYGLSRDTVSRGLSTLLRLGLLDVRVEYKKAPLAPRGIAEQRRYMLRPPFGPGFTPEPGVGAGVAAARRRARLAARSDQS